MMFRIEEHAANPPETWRVEKCAYYWRLVTKDGDVLETSIRTKRQAEALTVSGFYVTLYEKERRWYNGEPVSGWRPYAETVR